MSRIKVRPNAGVRTMKKLWINKEAYCIHCGSDDVVLVYECGGKSLAACDIHADMVLGRISVIRKRAKSEER